MMKGSVAMHRALFKLKEVARRKEKAATSLSSCTDLILHCSVPLLT